MASVASVCFLLPVAFHLCDGSCECVDDPRCNIAQSCWGFSSVWSSRCSNAVKKEPLKIASVMVPSLSSMAAARRCGSIYKGFAQCLLALGDSLSVNSQKEEDLHEIDSVCRSWDEFHDCANLAMAGCPDEAAAVWESLRQESKKMQFAGNLYDMCSSRSQSAADTGAQNPDETNQELLKGKASNLSLGQGIFFLICLCLLFLHVWI